MPYGVPDQVVSFDFSQCSAKTIIFPHYQLSKYCTNNFDTHGASTKKFYYYSVNSQHKRGRGIDS